VTHTSAFFLKKKVRTNSESGDKFKPQQNAMSSLFQQNEREREAKTLENKIQFPLDKEMEGFYSSI
jgi:hypothetical protein